MYNIDREVEHRLGTLIYEKQDANMTWYFKVEHDKVTPPQQCIGPDRHLEHRHHKVTTAFESDMNLLAKHVGSGDTLYVPVYDDMVSSTLTKDFIPFVTDYMIETGMTSERDRNIKFPGHSFNSIEINNFLSTEENRVNIKNKYMERRSASSYTGYAFSYARSFNDPGIGLLNDHWAYSGNIVEYKKNSCWFHHEIPAFKYDEDPEKYEKLVIKPFDTKQCKLVWRGADSGKPPVGKTSCDCGAQDGDYNLFQLEHNYHLKSTHRRDILKHYIKSPVLEVDLKFTDDCLYNYLTSENTCESCKGTYLSNTTTFDREKEYLLENNCEDVLLQTIYNANTKHKYVINIPGNDYSSNQWWVHGTSCIVFYPDFQKSRTVFDAYLKPWYHYVPFNATDPGDILDKIKWCENNIEQCKNIIKNSNDLHATMIDFNRREQVFAKMIPYIKNNLCI
tara:strand:- start:2070 stop:3416 length:1347 start_codon:yes stop_codon:yes gene_type:complete